MKELWKLDLEKTKDAAQAEQPEKEARDYYRKMEEEEEKAALELAEVAEYFRDLDTNHDGLAALCLESGHKVIYLQLKT